MNGGYDKFFQQARRATEGSGVSPKSGAKKGQPSMSLFKKKGDEGVRFSLSSKAASRAAQTKAPSKRKNGAGGREIDPAMFAFNESRAGMTADSASGSPEEQLRLELARRMQAKKKIAIRKRQKFPLFPAVCVSAALVSCAVGYFQPGAYDDAARIFHRYVGPYMPFDIRSLDIGFFGSANAASAESPKSGGSHATDRAKTQPSAEKSAETAQVAGEIAAATNGEAKAESVPNIRNWTPEELSFFNKLNERKKELDLREAELAKLDEELQKQREALDEKIKQLEAMRSQISQTLKSRVATDQQKVDKLVDFYSNMKPQQAAKVIETLNEDLSVEVLDKMKKKNAAEILNAMDAKKARRLSELLTGYQRSPASAAASASASPSDGAESSAADAAKAQ